MLNFADGKEAKGGAPDGPPMGGNAAGCQKAALNAGVSLPTEGIYGNYTTDVKRKE